MAGIEYYFNNLDPNTFQRLVNAILVIRFGEQVRLTPRFSADGGRDGDTAPSNPYFEFSSDATPEVPQGVTYTPLAGRYLFQVKHHRTTDIKLIDARQIVITDFAKELKKNVLNREGDQRVNFFFLITNVPSSEKSIIEIEKKQNNIRKDYPYLYAEVWWKEKVDALLDQMPQIWQSFPEIFAGFRVPLLASITQPVCGGLPRSVRIAIERQYRRDGVIKFRQIDLEKSLFKLFTNLDINIQYPKEDNIKLTQVIFEQAVLFPETSDTAKRIEDGKLDILFSSMQDIDELKENNDQHDRDSLTVLTNENSKYLKKIILEGGPGQGKSTLSQMIVQIYRHHLLNKQNVDNEKAWENPNKYRIPFRIELRIFGDWLNQNIDKSVDQYLSYITAQDAGGDNVTVQDIHDLVEKSSILLVFDGLDEVANDDLRNKVLEKISECLQRFEEDLDADVKIIITTRPPALNACQEHLLGFIRLLISPMKAEQVEEYVKRWTSVQIQDEDDRKEVEKAFEKRHNELHVQALAKNPMQLSVLLHFIRLKGAAFPDRRAELYQEYFKTVIDRDVEKSTELSKQREIIESLHQFLGYKIHALTEAKKADGSLKRNQLLRLVEHWLKSRGNTSQTAQELFKIGEERLGLIVALKGEGENTIYGFDVQPIREYFAAAFINNDIEGEAHEVFQQMIRRSYWREVSLFLAGLRRPNEKADIIARAKNLDSEEDLGWRQDGRNIILQLLQEGVFSQPPHVFSTALDFVFELFDLDLVNAQNEPKDLIAIFSALAKQDKNIWKRYSERLQKLLRKYNHTEDIQILVRLHRLAYKLFDSQQVNDMIVSYQSNSAEKNITIRLISPNSHNINLQEVSQSPHFWENVPEHLWARNLWDLLVKNLLPENLVMPKSIQQYLLEQYVLNPKSSLSHSTNLIRAKKLINSNLAIWLLTDFLKVLSIRYFMPRESLHDMHSTIIQNCSYVDYTGIDNEYIPVLKDLIEISHELLIALYTEPDDTLTLIKKIVYKLKTYFKQPGLISWLACQYCIDFLQMPYQQMPYQQFEKDTLDLALWESIQEDIQPLISPGTFKALSSKEKKGHTIFKFIPSNLLLENGTHQNIIDLLTSHILDEKMFPFKWLNSISLTSLQVRRLLTNCRNNIPQLCAFLGRMPIIYPILRPILDNDNAQDVLNIMVSTEDEDILRGAIELLSSFISNLLLIADKNLILKIIEKDVEKNTSSRFLFSRNRITLNQEQKEPEQRKKDIKIELAQYIIEKHHRYTFTTIKYAAEYLAENRKLDLCSLISIERDLKLHLQSSGSTGD